VTTDREIRVPGWLLTPDGATAATPTVLYLGESAAWTTVAEDAAAERLAAQAGLRVAVIDVRGRGDASIGYPARGRHYYPNRITNEAYLTWFTLALGRPLLGGQVHDALAVLRYLRARPDLGGGAFSLVGDGPHGVIAAFAAALDHEVSRLVLRQTMTDYRSLATAERYSQPFGIYAYGMLKELDLPDVTGAIAPRPVLLADPVTPTGDPAGAAADELYGGLSHVTIRALGDDPAAAIGAWIRNGSVPQVL
jgi:hypothetical protein